MKLLYITNGTNGAGGLERVLSVKASFLADNYSYEVHILVLNNMHQNGFYEFSNKIKFHSIKVDGNPLQYLQAYRKGIQLLVDDIQPDIISVCDDGLKAFFIPQFLRTRAKLMYERHVSKLIEAREGQRFFKKLMIRSNWILMEKLGQSFSKFIVLTEGNKNEWPSLPNLEVISNPLSFYPEQSSLLDSKTVICVGKISYQKGQDLLVKAWESVFAKHPDWQLHLYGKENIEVLDTNVLDKNILHFPPVKDIEKKYLKSSIYVMSSRFEGFGMVLIEAMACGVPCVSFDCDYGPSDIISTGNDGFVVEKANTNQLAEKIILLIENSDLRQAMGQQAKQNVIAYAPSIIAEKWHQLFISLMTQK